MNMQEQFPGKKHPLSVGIKGGSGEYMEELKKIVLAEREQEEKKKTKKSKKKNSSK